MANISRLFNSFDAARQFAALAILGLLVACATAPELVPGATPTEPGAVRAPQATAPATNPILRARARWVPVGWDELPGWDADRASELWPALLRGCARPAPGWTGVCAQARNAGAPAFDDAAARDWLRERLTPYRVESLDGAADGLITGYVEAALRVSRLERSDFRVPLYAPPTDLASRKPYWTREQLDTVPAARQALRGRVLAYAQDPLDALYLQIQGSGRMRIAEADGSDRLARFAFAGSNDQPYKSVGSWLVGRGEMNSAQASWPAIRNWAQQNPARVNEMLWSNPRVVFFREEALPDADLGPRGAQGVALTPGRSIAVDPLSIPYGTPVWLATTEPLTRTPLRRSVMAQDTGSAITGAVRADYFWGWGEAAEAQAGRMKQALQLWVLWPKLLFGQSTSPPKL